MTNGATHPDAAQVRWDNNTDEEVSLVVLRGLFEIGFVNCLGIVLTAGPKEMMARPSASALPAVRGVGGSAARSGGGGGENIGGGLGDAMEHETLEARAAHVRQTLSDLGLGHVVVSTDARAPALEVCVCVEAALGTYGSRCVSALGMCSSMALGTRV